MIDRLSALLRLKPGQKKFWLPTFLGLFVTLLFYFAYSAKPAAIEQVGDLLFDSYQRAQPREYDPNVPVRIIDIDNESLARIGQWPWPRNQMAKLNDRLADAGAGVIAYDVIFSERDRTSPENMIEVLQSNPAAKSNFDDVKSLKSHDKIFAESMSKTRVVAGFFLIDEPNEVLPGYTTGFSYGGGQPKQSIDNYSGAIAPLPLFERSISGEGFVSFKTTGDGIIRRAPLVARMDERYFPALSVEALRAVQGAGAFIIRSASGTEELADVETEDPDMARLKVGDFEIPTTAEGKLNVYYTNPQPERYIPAWKILSDEIPQNSWADRIGGHIVFVGTGALGLKDIVSTPIRDNEPGVLIHAQVTEQIIAKVFLIRPYWAWMIELGGILVFGVLLAFVLPRIGAVKGAIFSMTIAFSIAYVSWAAFRDHQMLLNPIYPLFAILTSYLLVTLSSFYLTQMERGRIRDAFSLYLSPTMVKKVSEDPSLLKLGGEEREMTVLFLDIRSFSKIAEPMQAQDITGFLNKFLTPMTDIIQDHKGTIDKYMGDAIVAFWNAPLDDPDHIKNAALSVLEMQTALTALNEKNKNRSRSKWPEHDVKIGIGLNTGVCCVGNLGSDQRFSYSMIGDAANLASRIEGLTKQYGVSVMIGEAAATALTGFAVLEADIIRVVGRQKPERVYVLVGGEEVAAAPEFLTFKAKQDAFLERYRAQDWKIALKHLKAQEAHAVRYGMAGYAAAMASRIQGYQLEPPPKEWDGVFEAQNK